MIKTFFNGNVPSVLTLWTTLSLQQRQPLGLVRESCDRVGSIRGINSEYQLSNFLYRKKEQKWGFLAITGQTIAQ